MRKRIKMVYDVRYHSPHYGVVTARQVNEDRINWGELTFFFNEFYPACPILSTTRVSEWPQETVTENGLFGTE